MDGTVFGKLHNQNQMLWLILLVLQVDRVKLDNIVAELQLPEELDFIKYEFFRACVFVVITDAICFNCIRLWLVKLINYLRNCLVMVDCGLRSGAYSFYELETVVKFGLRYHDSILQSHSSDLKLWEAAYLNDNNKIWIGLSKFISVRPKGIIAFFFVSAKGVTYWAFVRDYCNIGNAIIIRMANVRAKNVFLSRLILRSNPSLTLFGGWTILMKSRLPEYDVQPPHRAGIPSNLAVLKRISESRFYLACSDIVLWREAGFSHN